MPRMALAAILIGVLAITLTSAPVVEPASAFISRQSPVPLSDVIGTTITDSDVVGLRCIPERVDPVGVRLEVAILDAALEDDSFGIALETKRAQLGSHPSGCHDPDVAMNRSMFLLAPGDEVVMASRLTEDGPTTTLYFDLAGRDPATLHLLLAPTLTYRDGADATRTNVFGIMGAFELR